MNRRVLDPHGAKLSWIELRKELARRGLNHDQLDAIAGLIPAQGEVEAEGTLNERIVIPHTKCPSCGEMNPFKGGVMDRCHFCRWCRHPLVVHRDGGKRCGLCGQPDAAPFELVAEHRTVHFVDQVTGVVTRTMTI